ncbi:MAG: serine/threonine-protein kinase [Planctomycetota bacterium]
MSEDPEADAPGDSTRRYALRAVEALFHGALERPAGTTRKEWLRRATGGDEALITEVEELLSAHETADQFLEKSALLDSDGGDLDADQADTGAFVGATIGPYELVEELGEGGFGTVYRAEQTAPVRRQVALKIIKLGMDTRQVIARFEAERQALALMDHASIARVLDAGSTETGRPYFVMDLAPGEALTGFCDEQRLTIRERLEVFMELCSAVQHAHQRGVIHRDLKPSNVLVAKRSGRIVPKVIDFGIAKATGEDLTEATLFTARGQVIGTPVYMSPEQATGRSDIDTRSDVYSLGVILFELVTGSTPIRVEDIRERAAAGDLGTYVRDFEPQLASTRLARGATGVEAAASARGGSVSEVRREVRGDLDNVIHCALATDRDRRYESAAALARDVRRVLENRPVEASPPSAVDRTRKFLRRHRVLATAGTAVIAALLAGGTVALNSLRGKRDQAVVLSEAFGRFTDTDRADTAPELLRRATEAFGPDEPILVDALATRARRLTRAGSLEDALEFRQMALEVAERIHGPEGRETTYAHAALGLKHLRVGDRDSAKRELQTALDLDRRGPEPRSPALNEARLELASVLAAEGDVAAAEGIAEEAVAVAQSVSDGDRTLLIAALESLVELRRRGRDDLATREAWIQRIAAYEESYPESSAFLARQRVEYGNWLARIGRAEEAADELEGALGALGTLAEPPIELVYDALAALNRVITQEPTLATDDEARALIERELDVARERFDPSAADFFEALGRCSNELARRGDLARSTEVLVERFEAFTASVDLSEGPSRTILVLSEELAERADLIRRQDGLESEAYGAARDAAELASRYMPSDDSLQMTRVVLAARVGALPEMFGLLGSFETSSDVRNEHPILLALQSIAFYQAPGTQQLARHRLARAKELALEPQFTGLPGLADTLQWATRVVEGQPNADPDPR